jgi:hypothetical protein
MERKISQRLRRIQSNIIMGLLSIVAEIRSQHAVAVWGRSNLSAVHCELMMCN